MTYVKMFQCIVIQEKVMLFIKYGVVYDVLLFKSVSCCIICCLFIDYNYMLFL